MPQGSPVKTDIVFSTSLTIAGHMVDAAVYLAGGHPSLIVVDQIPSVSFSGIFNQFVSGSSWPSQAVDATLKGSVVFYVQQQLDAPPPGLPSSFPVQITNFAPGLYVATTVTLTLGGISVSAATTIGQLRGQGLTINVNLGSAVVLFDSHFLVLSDTGFAGTGPHLTVGGGAGTLECGVTLFGTQFGASSVTLTGGTVPKLSATLTYAGTLMGASNPSLSFSWDDTHGFQVTDFPILVPTALIDIVKELKTISQAAGCGALGNLVLNQVLQTSFYVTPSVTTTRPANAIIPPQIPSAASSKPIYVVISGYYKITLAGGTPVAAIDLPELVLSLPAPSSFTFDGILAAIGDFIAQNATAVVQQLWNDKPALGALLVAAVTPQVMNAVAANLACAGLKNLLNRFINELPKAPGGGPGGGASAEQALGAAAAAVAALAGACTAGGNTGGSKTGQPLATPALAAVSYQNGAVTASWGAVPAAAGYRAQLVDAGANVAGPVQFLPAGTLTTSFPVIAGRFVSGTASVQVLARAGGNTPALDSPFAQRAITIYVPPTNVSLSWNSGRLLVWWEPVIAAGAGPVTYNIRLYDDAAATHLVGAVSGVASPGVAITRTDGTAFAGGQSYRVSVATVAGQQAGAFSAASPAFPIFVIPQPTDITTTLQGGLVSATWQAITKPPGLTGQLNYSAELVEMPQPGAVVAKTLALPQTTAGAWGSLKPGQPYAVRVQASIGFYVGDWAYSPSFVVLGTPVVTGMKYDAANVAVIVHWQPVLGADSYEIAVRNSWGGLLQPPVGAVVTAIPPTPPQTQPPPQTATLRGSYARNFSAAGTVTVIIQARHGTSSGPWSDVRMANDPARLTIETLAAPSAPTATVNAGVVTATWTDPKPPAGVVYAVELLSNHAKVVAAEATSGTTANLRVPASQGGAIAPAGGGGTPPAHYTVRVRATTATSLGLWSPEVTVDVS